MSFTIALTGINAINAGLDTISNNIANSGTYGFKSSRANFSSMYAGSTPNGSQVSSITQSISEGGGVQNTGGAMDVSIAGRGFFASRDLSGSIVFTRVGMFSADRDGYVLDSAGRRAQGFAAIPGSTALGPMGDLKVPTGQIAASPSTKLQYVGNLSSDWVVPTVAFDPLAPDPQSFNSSSISIVYDSLGAKHSMTQYFVKTGTNAVDVHFALDGVAVGGTQALTFGTDGQVATPAAPVSMTLGTPPGADPLVVAIDYAGSTQFAGEATTTVNSADGFASGTLIGTQIDSDGAVVAQYSNGERQLVGTLAIATMPDETALTPSGDSCWSANSRTGTPLFFAPGTGMAAKLTTGALEQSNVDLTGELVSLMSSQRNYQANTKVIATESEMMQSLMQAL